MASKNKKTKEADDLTFDFEFDDIEGFCEDEDSLDGLILGGDILAAKVEEAEKVAKTEAEEIRWCMAMEDAQEIAGWVERGMIEHLDFYVGEIFKNGYRGVRDAIEKIARSTGGRVARFRNHSKVMAGFGEHFGFTIESSANINTNPRTEQTVITVDDDLALFYKEFFDGINSFDAGFEDWTPYQITGARYARAD